MSNKVKYLNLGCGWHYSTEPEWTNLDFVSTGPGVIGHNLLNGVPFDDNSFDLVYHSHVLEHFSKQDAEKFIAECIRVLKPGGVIRIAVPDLEKIARNYLKFMETGWDHADDKKNLANYEWMLMEMYDQTVRNVSGGNMGKYLTQPQILNEDFVFERIGEEGKAYRKMILSAQNKTKHQTEVGFVASIRNSIRNLILRIFRINSKAYEIGQFRLGGEIHQWMYDKYSLRVLLTGKGASQFEIRDAFTSYIDNWPAYNLDATGNAVRKPDSLFVEAIKK